MIILQVEDTYLTYFRTSTVTVSKDSVVTKGLVVSFRSSMIFFCRLRYDGDSNLGIPRTY